MCVDANKAERYVHIQKDVKKKKKSARENFASIRKWKRGKKNSPRGREGRDSSDG